MAIEGFDYKEFAQLMSSQAGELIPKDFNDMQKNYVVKTLSNFTLLAGEAIANDEALGFNADQAIFVTQIIAEWAFHKSIDLVHSGIMPEHWDGIMQKIAFTIFEVAKQAIKKNVPQDQILQLIEHHVNKTYKEAIDNLEKRGVITAEISQKAMSQSNIDDMAAQAAQAEAEQKAAMEAGAQEQAISPDAAPQAAPQVPVPQVAATSLPAGPMEKSLKLISVALVLKILPSDRVEAILDKFSPQDVETIKNYMKVENLEAGLDMNYTLKCLENIKEFLPRRKSPSQESIVRQLNKIFDQYPMENVEKLFKSERPFLKRFISKAYEGDYYPIPVKVAQIVVDYVKDSVE